MLLAIALTLTIVGMIFTTGCTGEPKTGESKNFSDNLTVQFTNEIQKSRIPIPIPVGTMPSQPRNQVIIVDFQNFLTDWNEKMNWGFSLLQIEDFNRSLRSDYLKKFDKTGRSLSYDIPDIKPFCLELGNEIGLTKNQSEVFASTADGYYLKGKLSFERPPPSIDVLFLDNCNIRIDRGNQKQLNITYQYTAWVSPGTVRFTSTQTPLTLSFNPSEFTVKSYTEFPAVVTIHASPSLPSGLYRFSIGIDDRRISELRCRTGGPAVDYGERMINVTVG